jgi:serine protease inhibitor
MEQKLTERFSRQVARLRRALFASVGFTLSAGLIHAAEPFYEGNQTFACELYAQLKAKEGNLFFSPHSISTCLAMTYAGARGDTEKQMAAVLHFNQKQDQLHSAFGALQRQLNEASARKGVELSVANALWAQKGHPFLSEFLKIGTSQYSAKLNQTDFKTQPDAAIQEINRWVAQKTTDKIQDILAPGSLDDSTRLALVNAIYFKGEWGKAFNKSSTFPHPFYLNKNREVSIPLMYRTDKVRYMEDDSIQAVELPYKGNELSMVILLPADIEGCSQLENSLDVRNLSNWLNKMKPQEVHLLVPRFKMESSFNLLPVLEKLGMRDAFNGSANFSGMDGTTDLFISLVSHKAWVEVTEEGTEAAAATAVAVSFKGKSDEPQRPTFRADHPFIFLIRHNRSGSILFLGRLADPTH